ncbi:MAG: hypothetical protein V1913_18650, partial [Fibrobacterota bacterium]
VGDGLGWDGQFYGKWAQTIPEAVSGRTMNSYHLQRVLPSALVHYGLRITGCSLSVPNVIRGFEILNIFCLTVAAFGWGCLADRLRISCRGKWLGFIAIFFNFCFLKFGAYYPVLTDTPAFTVAMLMLFAYLKDKLWVLSVLTVMGAFIWPMLIYVGMAFLVFPRSEVHPATGRRIWSYLWAGVTSAMVTAAAVYVHFICGYRFGGATPIFSLIYLSVFMVGAYVFLATQPLFYYFPPMMLKTLITPQRLGRLALAICILAAVKLVIAQFASGPPSLSFVMYMKDILSFSIGKPLVSYLGHVLYFGPIVIIMAFVWNRCCTLALQQGLGLSLALLLGVVMSIGASRHVIVIFPLLMPFVVKVVDEWPLNRSFFIWFILMALLFSKVWVVNVNSGLHGSILDFPWQKFFGSIGEMMCTEMYYIQGAFTLAVAALYYWFYFRRLALTANRHQ